MKMLLQPMRWARPKGYSNGIASKGHVVFLSGMIGTDASGKLVSKGFLEQTRQVLRNILDVLAEANGKPEHIVRMNWYVVDKKEYVAAYKELGIIYREMMGQHYPAMTAVQVVGLIEDDARVEIEVTAILPE
jgi:enamine deaminase RidA (YjgF/YER057c/UK114 family)